MTHLMPENVPEEDFTTITDINSIYDLFNENKISLAELDRLKNKYYEWYYSEKRHTTVLRFYRQSDGTMTTYEQVYMQTYGESGSPTKAYTPEEEATDRSAEYTRMVREQGIDTTVKYAFVDAAWLEKSAYYRHPINQIEIFRTYPAFFRERDLAILAHEAGHADLELTGQIPTNELLREIEAYRRGRRLAVAWGVESEFNEKARSFAEGMLSGAYFELPPSPESLEEARPELERFLGELGGGNPSTTPPPVVGFTGTRRGMSPSQKAEVRSLLVSLHPRLVRHGDCVGADAEFHAISVELGIPVWLHPSTLPEQRAYSQGAIGSEIPKEPLERNKDIINMSDIMIAAPGENVEVLRSGTWATIRYTRKTVRELLIVYPVV